MIEKVISYTGDTPPKLDNGYAQDVIKVLLRQLDILEKMGPSFVVVRADSKISVVSKEKLDA